MRLKEENSQTERKQKKSNYRNMFIVKMVKVGNSFQRYCLLFLPSHIPERLDWLLAKGLLLPVLFGKLCFPKALVGSTKGFERPCYP